jgi:5-methylcytosine-specific restriction endonuclease McrA
MNKHCNKCNQDKPATLEYFYPRPDRASGLKSKCKECEKSITKQYYLLHSERYIAKAAAKVKFLRETSEEYRKKDRLRSKMRKRKQLSDPIEYEKHLERQRIWCKNNPEKVKLFKHAQPAMMAQRTMRYYAAKIQAVPIWADFEKINDVYNRAKKMSLLNDIELHVDHIVPLKGKNVCGLHVHYNLQIITADKNRRKANKLIPELVEQIAAMGAK